MSQDYLPDQFDYFRKLLPAIYRHHYPEVSKDAELKELVACLIHKAENLVAGEKEDPTPPPKEDHSQRATQRSKLEKLTDNLVKAQRFQDAILNDEIDLSGHMNEKRPPAFEINTYIGGLLESRRKRCKIFGRDALHSGKLMAHWISNSGKIQKLENPDIWVLDHHAERAFREGSIDPHHGDTWDGVGDVHATDGEINATLILETECLNQTFPPMLAADNRAPTERGRPPDTTQAIRRELNRRHPDGYGGPQASLRRKIASEIERGDFDVKTFKKALAAHNEDVGFDPNNPDG